MKLVVKPIPVPSGYKHPRAPNDSLMNHEFTMGLIAPKGCGKTTVICNLLNFYRGYFNKIIVFSPTIESDEKWDWVKGQDLLVENKPLKHWLRKELEKKNLRKNPIVAEKTNLGSGLEDLVDEREVFSSKIPEDMFITEYADDKLMNFMDKQKSIIDMLKEKDEPKYLADRILIIFDDLVGSPLFAGSRGSYFKGISTRHRHYSMSYFAVSQGYKEIPKTVRTNFTGLIVFEIGNRKELEVIYEEFPMGLKRDDWDKVYQYCTKDEHSFMYLNFQKPRNLRIMKNLDQHVFYVEDKAIKE